MDINQLDLLLYKVYEFWGSDGILLQWDNFGLWWIPDVLNLLVGC